MRKPGEITVFLSLIIVCIMSLLAGLLESCRTAGARLYFQMAADSAMTSVMSQYNKNLWDMYGLLFLEYESEAAVEKSFADYFSYYEGQKNLYPMKTLDISMTDAVKMEDNGGKAFEDEVLSFVTYSLPSIAVDHLNGEAESILKNSDFNDLLNISKSAGGYAQNLQEKQMKIEDSLMQMEECRSGIINSARQESERNTEKYANKLKKIIKGFPSIVQQYENELELLSWNRHVIESTEAGKIRDQDMSTALTVELDAYRETEDTAKEDLEKYKKWESELTEDIAKTDLIVYLVNEPERTKADMLKSSKSSRAVIIQLDPGDDHDDDDDEPSEPDWEGIIETAKEIRIPEIKKTQIDTEKKAQIDAVKKIFDLSLLGFVLPAGSVVSEREVSLTDIPSSRKNTSKDTGDTSDEGLIMQAAEEAAGRLMIGQYALMVFDSFLEEKDFGSARDSKKLIYEQEYLLNGKGSDLKNLESTVLALIGIRSASNLFYLMSSTVKCEEVKECALLISGGAAPLTVILTYLIIALWALAEAVVDVRALMRGDKVPFWKDDRSWVLSIEGMLNQTFLTLSPADDNRGGQTYEDYIRMLLLLEQPAKRNFRMMDIIEWNVRNAQADFSTEDCAHEVTIAVTVKEKHLFAAGGEYTRSLTRSGVY